MLDELPIIVPAKINQNQALLGFISHRDEYRVQHVKLVILFYEWSLILIINSIFVKPTHSYVWSIAGFVPSRRFKIIKGNMGHTRYRISSTQISSLRSGESISEVLNEQYIIDCVLIFVLHLRFLDLWENKELVFQF